MFLPATCPGCGAPGRGPCAPCLAELRRTPVRRTAAGLDSLVASSGYVGVAAATVQSLKFRGAHRLAPVLSVALAELAVAPVDAVCWIPATASHRRRRGYDQSQLLAAGVARQLAVPSRRLLRRGRGPAQLGKSRAQRLVGPDLRPRGVPPRRVLVVDDVVTTGASFEAAARALRSAGAREIHGVALAATRR